MVAMEAMLQAGTLDRLQELDQIYGRLTGELDLDGVKVVLLPVEPCHKLVFLLKNKASAEEKRATQEKRLPVEACGRPSSHHCHRFPSFPRHSCMQSLCAPSFHAFCHDIVFDQLRWELGELDRGN